jgi:hypothetical protein
MNDIVDKKKYTKRTLRKIKEIDFNLVIANMKNIDFFLPKISELKYEKDKKAVTNIRNATKQLIQKLENIEERFRES